MKKIFSALLLFSLTLVLLAPASSAAGGFSDVPESSWAVPEIQAAVNYKLIDGIGDGKFGYGKEITRCQYITILSRMFNWATDGISSISFSDVSSNSWYYKQVEAAVANDVIDAGGSFRPNDPITREEMAVMLIRSLGYKSIAESINKNPEKYYLPFTDVENSLGYITIAYDIGMTNGKSADKFDPNSSAKREEAAAMLVRIYDKYNAETDHLSAFYAFSSYSQIGLTDNMDSVSACWSRLTLDENTGSVILKTTSSEGNEYYVPSGYQSAVSYLEANSTNLNLSVYMDTTVSYGSGSNTLMTILQDEDYRSQAVEKIIDELTTTYQTIGHNPYSGVTIDFEGLRGNPAKSAFNAFLTELRAQLDNIGKDMYVAVHPALASSTYYDGYDYKTIGTLADKVILMAYNYNANFLSGFVGSTYYRNTALTPISEVYYSMCVITDNETGIEDRSKIVLGLNTASNIGWEINSDNKLVDAKPIANNISTSSVYEHLKSDGAVISWSETYHNPYVIYKTDSGKTVFLWYEDSRSISDKMHLAKLFGINSFAVWRLGEIPNYTSDVFYDVYEVMK